MNWLIQRMSFWVCSCLLHIVNLKCNQNDVCIVFVENPIIRNFKPRKFWNVRLAIQFPMDSSFSFLLFIDLKTDSNTVFYFLLLSGDWNFFIFSVNKMALVGEYYRVFTTSFENSWKKKNIWIKCNILIVSYIKTNLEMKNKERSHYNRYTEDFFLIQIFANHIQTNRSLKNRLNSVL